MNAVDRIIDDILAVEGEEYTDNPADSGGPTKYGITQATLAKWRRRPVTPAEVAALTREEAREIYYHRFVVDPGYVGVLELSERIAAELVDTGVNMGPAVATMFLQRSLNALNRQQRDYPDIAVDGACGPRTLAALRAYLAKRGTEGETVLLKALNCLQGERYIDIAERRPKDEEFVYGWLRARVSL
mgnify:FL=1